MRETVLVKNPKQAIVDALEHPIASPPLSEIARGKLAARKARMGQATAVLVVSTIPDCAYKGDEGVLLPIIEALVAEGFLPRYPDSHRHRNPSSLDPGGDRG